MSPPAEKARVPDPVMTMQPTSSSAARRITPSCSSVLSRWFMALSCSGRFMVRMPTPSDFSTRTHAAIGTPPDVRVWALPGSRLPPGLGSGPPLPVEVGLEDAAKARGEATQIVRVAGGIDVHTFRVAPAEADLGDGGPAQSEGEARAHAGLEPAEAEVAGVLPDLAVLAEDADAQRVEDLPLVVELVGDQVGIPEAVVVVAPEHVLVVDVGASDGGLEIEGHAIVRPRIAHDDPAREAEAAEARVEAEAHVPPRLDPAEREVTAQRRSVEAIEDAAVGIAPRHGRARAHVGGPGVKAGRRLLVEHAPERGRHLGGEPQSRDLASEREAQG